ncbi:MAG: NAD(P)-binding protein [Desulfobacterales bacterium]|jgi:heterodisulfide reductase subunit A
MTDKAVVIFGSGVAGLSAALALAQFDIPIKIIEKSDFTGGRAIQFACKATDKCVKCGACLVEDKLNQALRNSRIEILTGCRIENISKTERYVIRLNQKPKYIDAQKCNACATCLNQCPQDGAIIQGTSRNHSPFFAINEKECQYLVDQSCSLCQEACPEKAIALDAHAGQVDCEADAIIWATGFSLFNPQNKPYGYGVFKNVVTNMELENILRSKGQVIRPSDGQSARKIAFIQCVGSRDAKLNHLWCSKICCGSALRMAGLIHTKQPESEISFFYIDVQTFGRDFVPFYRRVQEEVRMIRAIPGDIFETPEGQLRVTYITGETHEAIEEIFDCVVLSVGLQPCEENQEMTRQLNLKVGESGFLIPSEIADEASNYGIFSAGAVGGPMGIAESIASAGETSLNVLKYFGF